MLYYKEIIHPHSDQWVVFIHGAGGSSAIWFKQLRDFSQCFNLLLIDLRGHGKSLELGNNGTSPYTFELVARDVIEVLDYLKLPKAHFVGVSLGTLILKKIEELAPDKMASLVMTGAIVSFNTQSKLWLGMGRIFKNFVPFMWLYKIYARVLLPSKNHTESRHVFINEAKKLCQREFLKWFRLTGQISGIFDKFKSPPLIPTLYVMGEEDYLFLEEVKRVVTDLTTQALVIVKNCGHVVNIEKAEVFNQEVIRFISQSRSMLQPQWQTVRS